MHESSIHRRRNQILILIVIVSNVIGNVALSHGMRQTGAIVSASPLDYVRAFARPWTVVGVAVLAGWMISNLALLSRADLSFVLPVTAGGYVLIAVAGHFFLGERISAVRWIGIAAIALGVILAEETPSRTTEIDGGTPSGDRTQQGSSQIENEGQPTRLRMAETRPAAVPSAVEPGETPLPGVQPRPEQRL
ncbi:MAG TPA: hypothetical protein VFI72_11805 [Candidatus Angelobacter sp.]|nr:hypothetical protein [Candidatus Angelobacter sp.]